MFLDWECRKDTKEVISQCLTWGLICKVHSINGLNRTDGIPGARGKMPEQSRVLRVYKQPESGGTKP